MKAPITSAQAMAHPTVVETVNALGQMCEELRAQLEAPDCRTCVCYYTDDVGPACLKNGCTNGDKYQPEPKVVLWRTE